MQENHGRVGTLLLISLAMVLGAGGVACSEGESADGGSGAVSAPDNDGAGDAARSDQPLDKRIKSSLDRAIRYIRGFQDPQTGAVSIVKPYNAKMRHPGITALAVLAYVQSPRGYTSDDGPFVRNALEWLAGLQKDDGSIYERGQVNYVTSIALTALVASGEEKYQPVIERARDFLVRLQAREETGYRPGDKFYGGVGYGGDERPDLSNAQFAIEAARKAGLAEDDPFFEAAVVFLQRNQNWSETNDQQWKDAEGNAVRPGNDGGAMYLPGESKAGIEVHPDGTRTFRSYGSMSYALLKSYLFCGLKRADPRVRAVAKWCADNFELDRHPGFVRGEAGNEEYQGLFYYYYSLAKALSVWGERELVRSDGTRHDWAVELAEHLLTLQDDTDGSFLNERSGRWEESLKVLCTCYAALALEECLDFMKRK